MQPSLLTSLISLSMIAVVSSAHAQAPAPVLPPVAAEPPSVAPALPTPVAPPPPATPPAITADALLGFLQREAATSGSACALSTTYRVGARLVIACGASGVWIAQVDAQGLITLVARQMLSAPALRLFDGGGRLWAEVQGGGAVMIDPNVALGAIPPPPPPSTGAQYAPPAPPTNGLPGLPSDRPGATPASKPRIGGIWSVTGTIRPFLALETLGGGALLDGSIGYRSEDPFHIWALVQPLGLATGEHGVLAPFLILALASIDTRTFELGLGVGVQSVNDVSNEFDVNGAVVEPGSGITISQFARLGQVDGVSVSIRSDIVLFHSKFELSNVYVQGQLPLRGEHAIWIVANGGGGTTGYALGEVGLRTRVRGDGGADSLFITVTVGGTSFFSEDRCEGATSEFDRCDTDYAGPLLGVSGEWRL